jgi:CelD/BcsL family acetyltransferase involved in cellulose biosynthesis
MTLMTTLDLTEPRSAAPDARASGRDAPVRVVTTGGLHDLSGLWPRSGDTGAGQCYAFQGADVLAVWGETIGAARGVAPVFTAVTDAEGRPLLLLPLGIERRHGLRVLTFLDGGVADYNAPVVFPAAAAWSAHTTRSVWQALLKALPPFDVAVLDKMPERVGALPNPLSALATLRHAASGHALSLSGTWEDFAKTRLPRRQDSSRKRRRLEKLGMLTFDVAETPEQCEAFLEAMIHQKTRRFRDTGVADDFDKPGYRAFFPAMTHRFAGRPPLHLSVLKLDDTILAAHWGYVAGDRFYYLMPSFEGGDWIRYSAGRLLIEHLIEWSYARGLAVVVHECEIVADQMIRQVAHDLAHAFALGIGVSDQIVVGGVEEEVSVQFVRTGVAFPKPISVGAAPPA